MELDEATIALIIGRQLLQIVALEKELATIKAKQESPKQLYDHKHSPSKPLNPEDVITRLPE